MDGETHDFAQVGSAHGCPTYQRVDDVSLWCRNLLGFGWSVCTDSGQVLGRPFENPGQGALPPEGLWVSARGERAYLYDMTTDERAPAG